MSTAQTVAAAALAGVVIFEVSHVPRVAPDPCTEPAVEPLAGCRHDPHPQHVEHEQPRAVSEVPLVGPPSETLRARFDSDSEFTAIIG
jgi:hypothetical protein